LKHRLPAGYEAQTYLPSELDPAASEEYGKILAPMVQTVCADDPSFVGRGVLTYWRRVTPEDSNVSLSVLSFYQRVLFVTITAPREPSIKTSAVDDSSPPTRRSPPRQLSR
jgi:hypothetical protein